MRRHMKKAFKIFAAVLVLGVIAAGGVGGFVWQRIQTQGTEAFRTGQAADIPIVVEKGASPRSIAKLLQQKGVIADDERFLHYLRFVAQKADRLRAGEYVLRADMTADDIIAELQTGRQRELRFTIPEGSRQEEIAQLIAASGIASEASVLQAMTSKRLLAEFGVPDTGAGGQKGIPGGIEGYLFPDTYQFPKGTPPLQVLQRMRARLDDVIDDKMKARMKEMGWSLHKVLTLAAIVEKETGQPQERPHIASVFHNRLKLGMKMQTDPTVIYGIENYDGNIRKKDLLTPHPYNTYTIPGLPPGPIASPGLAAIRAVLWPDEGKDLYFVSRNDGTHIFCPTLECHNAAVRKWQVEYFRQKRKRGG